MPGLRLVAKLVEVYELDEDDKAGLLSAMIDGPGASGEWLRTNCFGDDA